MFSLAVKEMAKKMAEVTEKILREAEEAAAKWRASRKSRARIVDGKSVPGPTLHIVVDDAIKELVQAVQREISRITQDRDFPEGAVLSMAATAGLKEMLKILEDMPVPTLPAPL